MAASSHTDATATSDLNAVGGLTGADRSLIHAGGGYLPSPVHVVVMLGGKPVEAVISGISFLGAGTVIRAHDDRVEGLTTAATLLYTAAVGIAVALSRWLLAVSAVGLAILLLRGLHLVERRLAQRRHG